MMLQSSSYGVYQLGFPTSRQFLLRCRESLDTLKAAEACQQGTQASSTTELWTAGCIVLVQYSVSKKILDAQEPVAPR